MRTLIGLWLAAALVGAGGVQAADSPEEAISSAKEQALRGNRDAADSSLEQFLKKTNVDAAAGEAMVREQIGWGSLPAAAFTAEVLLARAELTGPNPGLKRLLEEVMALHHREVDRMLALTEAGMAKVTPDWFVNELPRILRRTAGVDPVKSEKAVRHVFALLRSVPVTAGASPADHVSSQFLVKLGQVPGLMGTVLELADAAGLTPVEDWYGKYVFEMTQSAALCRPGHVVAALTGPALGGDLESFRDLPLSRQGDAPTLLARFAELLGKSEYAELRWEVLQALQDRQRETFGMGMTRLLLDEKKGVADLQVYLKRHEKDLARLNDRAAGNLLSLLATRFEEAGRSGTVDAELRTALRPLLEAEAWHLDSTRLAWRNAKHLAELKLRPDEAPAAAEAVLKRLVLHGSSETGPFLEEAVRLLVDGSGAEGRKRAGNLLRETAKIPELTAEVLKVAKREGFLQDDSWLAETLKDAWRPQELGKQPERLLLVLAAAGLLGEAGDFAGSIGPVSSGRDGFLNFVLNSLEHRTAERNALLSALEKRPARTFGVAVLSTLLKPGREKGMIRVGVEFREALAALPADQRSQMAAFFAQWVGNDLAVAKAVPGFAAELNITLTERSLKLSGEVDRLLSLNSVAELYPEAEVEMQRMKQGTESPSESMKALAATLAEALSADANTAAEAFGRVSGMIYERDRLQAQQMPDKRIRLFGIWLLAALEHPVLHPLVQKELGKIVLQRTDYFWVERAEKQLVPVEDFKKAETAVARMERCGLLVPATEFKPLNLARHCSMPETFSRRIEEMPAAVRGEAARLLLDRKPAVFGGTVMAALLQPTWEEADQVLKGAREELGRLSVGDVQLVFRAFAKLFPQIQEAGVTVPEGGVLAFMLKVNQDAEARVLKPQNQEASAPAGAANTWLGADATVREFRRLWQQGDIGGARELFNRSVLKPGDRLVQGPEEVVVFHRSHVPGFGNWREERLMSLFRKTPAPDLAGLWLGGAALDQSGQLGLPGTSLALEVSLSLEQGWQEAGGQAVPEKAILPFMTTFATGLGEAPAVVAAPAFSRFLKGVPRKSRHALQQWAATVPAGDKLHDVAQELAFAIALVEGGNAEAAWSHYTKLMADARLNPRVRLDLAAHLCAEHPRDLPPAIVLEGVRLAVASWIRRDWNEDDAMVTLFEAFLQLPESGAWNEVAGAFAQEWKTLVKAAVAAKKGRGSNQVERMVLGILSRLGDQEGIDLHLKYHGGSMTEDRWRIAVLARHGQPHRAAELVRKKWPAFTGNFSEWLESPPGPPLPDYTRVAALAGMFREGEQDIALIAEYLLLYDARPRSGVVATPADEEWARRFRDLATKVAKSPVTNREARKALHGLLVTLHPETLLELSDGIVQDLAATGWRTGSYQAHGQAAWPVELLGMHAAVRALDGDLSGVWQHARQIGRILQLEQAAEPLRRTEARGAYFWQVLEGVAANAARLSLAQRAEFMKRLEREMEGQGTPSWGDILLVKWVVDCWAAADAGDEKTAARGTHGDYDFSEEQMRHGLLVLARLAHGAPLPFRERLMLAAAETQVAFELVGRRWVNVRQMLLPCGLLSPDELIGCGPGLVHALRDSSKTAQELAMLADDLGRDVDVVALADAGLAGPVPVPVPGAEDDFPEHMGHLPVDEQVVLWRSLVLRKASGLIRLKQMDAAKQVLTKLGDSPRDEARVVLEKLASANP